MSEILVVGSIAYDSIETELGSAEMALGGSATYFSAAAQFFSPVRLVGVVGDDFGPEDLAFFDTRNVDTAGLKKESGKTFYWKGRYEKGFTSRTTLATHLNVFETFKPELPSQFLDSHCVFLANIHPELQLEVLDLVREPAITAMDTMNLWIDTSLGKLKEVMRRARIVVINDEEARQLTGYWALEDCAQSVSSMGPQVVIIKKGEHGVFVRHSETSFTLPAYPVSKVVDPTGAGDTFAGGFMGVVSRNLESPFQADLLRQAAAAGTILASFCVEGFGTERLASLEFDEVRKRYQGYREMLRLKEL